MDSQTLRREREALRPYLASAGSAVNLHLISSQMLILDALAVLLDRSAGQTGQSRRVGSVCGMPSEQS